MSSNDLQNETLPIEVLQMLSGVIKKLRTEERARLSQVFNSDLHTTVGYKCTNEAGQATEAIQLDRVTERYPADFAKALLSVLPHEKFIFANDENGELVEGVTFSRLKLLAEMFRTDVKPDDEIEERIEVESSKDTKDDGNHSAIIEKILGGDIEVSIDQLTALLDIFKTMPEFTSPDSEMSFRAAEKMLEEGETDRIQVTGMFNIQGGEDEAIEPSDYGVVRLFITRKSKGSVLNAASYTIRISQESEGMKDAFAKHLERKWDILYARLEEYKKSFVSAFADKINQTT